MGYDFQPVCQVDTRKVVWLVGLILASVLVIQYFDRNGMLSLLTNGKGYLSFSDAYRGGNGDIGLKEKQSYLKNNSSLSRPMLHEGSFSTENFMPESTADVYRTAAAQSEERSISLAPEKAIDTLYKVSGGNAFPDIGPSVSSKQETTDSVSGENSRIAASPAAGLNFSLSPMVSPSQSVFPRYMDKNLGVPVVSCTPASTFENEVAANTTLNSRNPDVTNSSQKEMPEKHLASVVSLSEMNDMLLHSRVSSFSKRPLWPSDADQDLIDARFQTETAAIVQNHPSLYSPIYQNLSTFVRSYEMMEQKLKIYIYKEGKRPVFHQPRLKGIYASEGWFMKLLKASNQYVTRNPTKAHLFYLPFSSQLLVDYVYVPDSHTFHDITEYLKNYLDTIKGRYSFWNRTDGEDHFLVACHDWAPVETRRHMANCIRALCNADVKEGFQFGKDVSLPETYIHSPQNSLKEIGGKPPSKRKILAFFAGQLHGYVRPILLQHWENKDPDMKIFGRMQKASYVQHMKNSKYCICAKGYEVNSPRVVEAIIYECVPVIISDNFVPPFFEILKWDAFAVFVPEKDIPNLKNILLSISEKRYLVMQQRVKQVRLHFLWHNTPVKYDIFHMILHSLWYNRVFRVSPP